MITTDNIFQDYPDIVSTEQMRQMLHIGKKTAYELLNRKDIKSIRIGKTHKIPKINIIAYLNENNTNN